MFVLFHSFFQDKNFKQLNATLISETDPTKVSNETYASFLSYVAAFYQYMCNYHSFGSKKFIPELSKADFVKILKLNPLYQEDSEKGRIYQMTVNEIYPQIEREIFDAQRPFKQFGFPSEGASTAYFSPSMTKQDLKLIKAFLESQKISPLNTRAFKKDDSHFIISVGSISSQNSKKDISFQGKSFDIEFGEFSDFLI